ncbi:rhamnulokinase [Niallia taxi]|uniref:rhamnulokinase n=1 Tax=Niallia taxi TaxID=2499688 RepID=UPI003D2E6A05
MNKSVLAVDIGASSGRLMLGSIHEGKLVLDELHRFSNSIVKKGQYYCWDLHKLFVEIKQGIKKCQDLQVRPESIGIDTWAVDFVLLDENGNLLTEAVSYRDDRTDGVMEEVFQKIIKERIYLETGIQFQKFNTIYQLCALKQSNPESLDKADKFLMVPDYFHYLLTGKAVNEYTNATSTQLVNAFTKKWDKQLLDAVSIKPEMFQDIKMPGTILGDVKEELAEEFGFNLKVVLPATHDTASAVISVPEHDETIYISSGTWSLIGVENKFPICVTKALDYNFTNEGGIDYRFRFLKNIMGLWMIQEVRRNYDNEYSFAEFVELAKAAKNFQSIVNVNDDRFLNPDNMIIAIQNYCAETNQEIPVTPGEVAKCVYDSLVECYVAAIDEIEEIFEKKFTKINIIGGGCQNELLNQLIADATKKQVFAGPVEATAVGNIVSQLIALGEIKDVHEARKLIKHSFDVKGYEAAQPI